MTVIRKLDQPTPEHFDHMFFCPGCNTHHVFKTTGGHPKWTFNDDLDKPTLKPSLLVKYGEGLDIVCHSFIEDGNIRYLGDCTHHLAGQTVPLPDFGESHMIGEVNQS